MTMISYIFSLEHEEREKEKKSKIPSLPWDEVIMITWHKSDFYSIFDIKDKILHFVYIEKERKTETDRQTTRIRNYGLYWKIYTCVIFQFDLSPILAYEVYGITTYKSELQIVIFLLQILVQQYFILFNIIWHFNVLCIWSIYFFFHLCEDVKTPR